MTKRFSTISTIVAVALLLHVAQAAAQKGGGGFPPLNQLVATHGGLLNFGPQPLNGFAPKITVRLTNYTALPVDLDIPSALGAFAVAQGAGSYSLASGAYVDVRVEYRPTMVGAEFVEFYPSEDSDLVLSFAGESTRSTDCGQEIVELDFGSVDIGSPDTATLLVGNKSGEAQSIQVDGPCNAFEVISSNPIVVADGQIGQFTIEFDPLYEGGYVGEFTTGCGTTVWLLGTGVDPMAKGPGVGDVASPGRSSVTMAAAPNPMRQTSQIRFAYIGDATLSGKLRIVDVRGRVLRTESLQIAPGSHVWEWDRRDGAGHSVASGMYFIELVAPGTTARQKVTVLR